MDATNKDVLDKAAWLLVDIAGPASHHIEMSKTGPKKYYSVARALTFDDARRHLRGIKTRGALCSHPGGQTRALAYDGDDVEHWQLLRQAARHLAEARYRPLLEPSPRGRGGHLWLLYTALVDTQAARYHAQSIAPELAQITEYWPGPPQVQGWNRIRLPGGRYVAPGFSAWCKLYDAQGQELARDGMSVARVLLSFQTDASLIPALPPEKPRECDASSTVTNAATGPARDSRSTVTTGDEAPTNTELPPKRYSPASPALRNVPATLPANRYLWFQYSTAQLAEWFNERHSLDELHPRERGGMAFSPSVSERTPSTGYHDTPDGERWTDFSTGARRADGRPDGGDDLELYIRLQGGDKAAVLSSLGREMVQEARQELEAAGKLGTEPPLWVTQITTPAGWEHYRRLAQAGEKAQGDA